MRPYYRASLTAPLHNVAEAAANIRETQADLRRSIYEARWAGVPNKTIAEVLGAMTDMIRGEFGHSRGSSTRRPPARFLEAITEANVAYFLARNDQRTAIALAREAGAPWPAIAAEAGVSV